MVSLYWSMLEIGGVSADDGHPLLQSGSRGARAPPVKEDAAHLAMLWTVILGKLVVNCLVTMGMVVKGVPLRVLKAGQSSLEFIGKERGVLQVGGS